MMIYGDVNEVYVTMKKKSDYFQGKKIKKRSVVQQVIDALTQAMIDKELKPGDKIPTELELSESLGVGRLSIREAIKVLVYYGVLEIRRPEGTFVCEGISDNMIDPMLYGIILHDDESYGSIKELRQMMEVGVIKLAMQKCTADDKKELMEKYDDFKKAVKADCISVDEVFEADNEFHRVVSEIGGNPLIDKINSLVRILTYDIRYETVKNMIDSGEGKTLLSAHKKICDAIFKKDDKNIEDVVDYGYFYDRVGL